MTEELTSPHLQAGPKLPPGVLRDADTGFKVSAKGSVGVGVYGGSSDDASYGLLGGTGYGAYATSSNGSSSYLAGQDPAFGQHVGAFGESDQQGVMGLATSNSGTGVYGGGHVADNQFNGIGVRGETFNGTAIEGQSYGPTGMAARFIGDVTVTGKFVGDVNFAGNILGDVHFAGNINVAKDVVLVGADCAEHFDVPGQRCTEPGTVLVIHAENELCESSRPYDKRVAGVVSGAGDYRPGIILDRQPSSQRERAVVALMGKVYCKVDANFGSIEVGDLLTTSATPGHAMKAADATRTLGAVVGKALRPIKHGQGLIPILVALQ